MARVDDLQFGLSDAVFGAWWASAIYAEDASEYKDLHGGRLDGARFVCAVAMLTGTMGKQFSADLLVRAYMLAMRIDTHDETGKFIPPTVTMRQNAMVMYEDDAVQMLLDRVRHRSARFAEERIRERTVAKIEDLYDRPEPDFNPEEDPKVTIARIAAHAGDEKLALQSSIQYLGVAARDRAAQTTERNRRSVQEAMRRAAEQPDYGVTPPDKAQLRADLEMAKEHLGAEVFYEVLEAMLPKRLNE